jgi:DNA repair protein RadC
MPVVPPKIQREPLPCCASVLQNTVRHGAFPWGKCFASERANNNRKEGKIMKNEAQGNLFGNAVAAEREATKKDRKMFTVQKYRLSYVKEKAAPIASRQITTKSDVVEFCNKYLSQLPIENVCIIALDTGNNIIGFEAVEGATNQCAVYPSNCFRFLLCTGASAFILAHNHPGNSAQASEADWNITDRLKNAGKLLEIPLLDHIIVTEDKHISMRDSSRWDRN